MSAQSKSTLTNKNLSVLLNKRSIKINNTGKKYEQEKYLRSERKIAGGDIVFVVIGERINTSRKRVREAVAERDAAFIREDVLKQENAGASYIDVNAGARISHEMDDMKWLIDVIQEVVTVPLCLDSPDPKVLEMAYGMSKKPPMINSISLEKNRYNIMMPFLEGKQCSVLALCMGDSGMPKNAAQVIDRAKRLVQELENIGMNREGIYVDPLVQPVSTESTNGIMAREAVAAIMQDLPGVHTTCGLSNISFGLPVRKRVNRIFLTLMMASGLDTAIADPLDHELMTAIKIAEVLLGKDEYCRRYLRAYRAGRIPK